MTEVPATEFARHFSRYREAAQRQAVAVKSHDRIAGYFVSTHDFAEYQRLKALASVAVAVEDLDAETIRGLAASRMDKRHDALDELMA